MVESDLSVDPVERLVVRLGHEFNDDALLELALTHRSWCAEQPNNGSNERLEFLGDAVVGLVVTEELYALVPQLPEGEMAKARASVVSTLALAEVADDLGVGDALRLGRGEHLSGGRKKASILADALEALVGAVHTDGGLLASRALILGLLSERLASAAALPGGYDHKTQLQELAARVWEVLPIYELSDIGPDHDKRFDARVLIAGELRGVGHGRSKKQAEQAAAAAAWASLVDAGLTGAAASVPDTPAGATAPAEHHEMMRGNDA